MKGSTVVVSASPINFSSLFSNMPQELRANLETTYSEIIRNFHEGRFEPSELNGGKFCETVYRILEWYTHPNHQYTPFGTSIRNFGDSTRRFESLSGFLGTIRLHIPRLICILYDIRNHRGVGHVGGDINYNYMDSRLIVQVSKWILADLVRIFHNVSVQEAQDIVDRIVAKEYPIIWKTPSKKRVLDTSLSFENQVLVLLYSENPRPVLETDLFSWIEYSNSTIFRKNIIVPLHKGRMIDYDPDSKNIMLSPKGIKFVEENINLHL